MMQMFRMWRAILFVVVVACTAASGVRAQQLETAADHAILLDVETKTVLFEKKADELFAPGSMVKLLTLAVVFEALDTGKIKLDSELPVSLYAWKTGGAPSRTTAMFAPLNTNVKVEDLILGAIIQGGNDACIVLAEGLAGSEGAFVAMMTEYARKIGMPLSSFGNSSGLPSAEQKMTAREVAFLTLHIVEKYPKYYTYFAQKEFNFNNKHRFYNRNPLLAASIGADGVKTSQTEDGGYGIVGSALNNGRRLIVVINGVESMNAMRDESLKLLNWGFRSFEKYTVFNADETVGEAMTWGGERSAVKLRGIGGAPVQVLLPKNVRAKKLHGQIVYVGPVKAPIAAGERVGNAVLKVTADGGISATAPLEAAEDVALGGVVRQGFDSLKILALGWYIHRKSSSSTGP